MTLSEMIIEVQDIVQDATWTDARITGLLNRALRSVAAGVMLPGKYELSRPLPGLYATDDVTTVIGKWACDLPADYQRNVTAAVTNTGDELRIEPSFRKFLQQYPATETGSVTVISAYGNQLLYRQSPSVAQTITLHYYRAPAAMEDDDDEPDGLPDILAKPILVSQVCRDIFAMIEDGMDGRKANTEFWAGAFVQGMADMDIIIPADGLPEQYDQAWPRLM